MNTPRFIASLGGTLVLLYAGTAAAELHLISSEIDAASTLRAAMQENATASSDIINQIQLPEHARSAVNSEGSDNQGDENHSREKRRTNDARHAAQGSGHSPDSHSEHGQSVEQLARELNGGKEKGKEISSWASEKAHEALHHAAEATQDNSATEAATEAAEHATTALHDSITEEAGQTTEGLN